MRMRHLVWAALLLAALASLQWTLDWARRHRQSPGLVERYLIGSVRVDEARIILVETPIGQVTLRHTAWGWVVDEQDGFAADVAKMRALLLRMAQTPIGQRVPIAPEQLGDMGLLQKVENQWRFEAGRTASVLTLVHGEKLSHRLIYQVLIGNPRSDGNGTYVRFPESHAVYLVPDRLELDGRAEAWIEHRVFEPDAAAAVREIRVRTGTAPLVTLMRAAAGHPWQMAGAAAPPAPERLQELATALVELRIAAVSARGQAGRGAPAAASVEVRFFDGRSITLGFLPAGAGSTAGRQAVLAARLPAEQGDRALRRQVEAFNRHFATRTVTLSAAQAATLLRGREAYRAAP